MDQFSKPDTAQQTSRHRQFPTGIVKVHSLSRVAAQWSEAAGCVEQLGVKIRSLTDTGATKLMLSKLACSTEWIPHVQGTKSRPYEWPSVTTTKLMQTLLSSLAWRWEDSGLKKNLRWGHVRRLWFHHGSKGYVWVRNGCQLCTNSVPHESHTTHHTEYHHHQAKIKKGSQSPPQRLPAHFQICMDPSEMDWLTVDGASDGWCW